MIQPFACFAYISSDIEVFCYNPQHDINATLNFSRRVPDNSGRFGTVVRLHRRQRFQRARRADHDAANA